MYIKTTIYKKGVDMTYKWAPPPRYEFLYLFTLYIRHKAANRRLDSFDRHSLEYRSLSDLGLKVRRALSGSGLKQAVLRFSYSKEE
ncbi:MAG: hypothetical protein LBK25_01090 [Treponema sp.]|jgi:hypothetical protein|nr:hypothetical protein [Treponema sp.]